MTEDERIDEIIRSAASDYNRPPATPKDEMWTAILAARESAAVGPRLHVTAGGAPRRDNDTGYRTHGRSPSRYAWFGMAAAAALLVATGIGIGRWTSSDAPQRQIADAPALTVPQITGDGIPVQPSRSDDAPAVVPPSTPAANTESAGPPRSESQRVEAEAARQRERTREQIRRDPQVRGSGELRLAQGIEPPPSNQISYQVATTRHLADAEALLTSFSLESRDERMNAQFAGWAKGLLSNTRLLLDSPAGEDPRRATLLQDLEMVLAQIVQLSPNAAAQDRELINGTIEDGQVMTRLRTAIPAGQPRAITER